VRVLRQSYRAPSGSRHARDGETRERKFIAELTAGSLPTAFAFAAIGAGWADKPILALVVSYVLAILLLPMALYLMRRRA
jgi:Mn2+/Fe2+ NRAMP family transporter